MRLLFSTLAMAIAAEAHCIFQKVSVNGQELELLDGLRAPSDNNPVQDPSASGITCGADGTKSPTVIDVKAGDEIGAWYQHVIGGAQGPADADNPIASSHKGPITAYLAAVDSASSAAAASAGWFKIYEDTFDPASGVWGVDNMIANGGWVRFGLPACIPDGEYLLRVETLALHSAYARNGAQFYTSCAQLRVSGGGSTTPGSTVSFPGAYTATDPSVMINIYGTGGVPDMGGQEYPAHGPAVFTC
ncbi:glycoside hydrolase family 61 protein [Biscogniauxia mediterranea]|nr:glycoside hydrolase family 61 protein [Biscogniauxia mediterranea]